MDRRDLITSAALLGLSPLPEAASPADSAAAGPATALDESEELRGIRQALGDLRGAWLSVGQADLESIRAQQRIVLKSTGRYPELIDVGLDVWERLYDWHVRWQQPIRTSRLADGSYGMLFMFTTLVLKPNMQTNYVGPGYDAK